MDATTYKQLRAFAAQYGAAVGLIWIASFAFYVIGLTRPLVGNLALLTGLLSIVAAGLLLRRFRQEVCPLRFWQTWWMGALTFMYASVLMAVAQFVYFRYIDHGQMADAYAAILQQPEAIAMMQGMMPGEDVGQAATEVIGLLRTISPIRLTFEFLIYDLALGLVLAFPTAWIAWGGSNRPTQRQSPTE